jgi:predicted TIM-barrel fold metal-dependent hydrolase
MSKDANSHEGGVIDVHHHIIPNLYRKAMDEAGLRNPIPRVDYPAWSVDSSLAVMDKYGVAAAVVSITDPGIHFGDQADATVLAHDVNQYFAELVRNNPRRFGAFAVLPLPDVDAALVELEHAIDVLKLEGVGMLTHHRGIYLGDPSFAPLFGEIERRGVPVFVHPATPPSKDQPTFDLPPSLYEFTFDTTRAVVSLLYSGILEKHPNLRLILSHGGGTIPYLAKRLTYGPLIHSRLSERAPKDVLTILRRLYYDLALAATEYALPSLQALLDPSHILFGSDFPFMPDWYTGETVEKLNNYKGFNEFERELIRRGNARQLFPRLTSIMAA